MELDNLRIKPEALDKLELPFAVSGSIGNLSVSVPWTSLHKTPVEVHVRDVFLLVDKSAQTSREAMRRALSAKRRALAAAAQLQARRCVPCVTCVCWRHCDYGGIVVHVVRVSDCLALSLAWMRGGGGGAQVSGGERWR